MPRQTRRVRQPTGRLAALLLAGGLLAGCGAAAAAPDWRPQPPFSGEGPYVQLPTPNASPTPSQPNQSPRQSPSNGGSAAGDSAVVAKKLTAPTALTLLPDGTALVGERTTGRIVRVQPQPNRPVQTVRTLTGLDSSSDGD